MMSNKGLNSNEALDESTATNSSVTLSGIRREKEAPAGLDIVDYRPDSGNSDPLFPPRARGPRRGKQAARYGSSSPRRVFDRTGIVRVHQGESFYWMRARVRG